MTLSTLFFAEQSLVKLAASFRDGNRAARIALAVRGLPGMHDDQVQVIHPHDREWGRKVEPENAGIWRTALQAHLACGALGLAIGAVVFAAFYAFGVRAVTATPTLALIAMVLLATMLGLIGGGVLTVRPDHEGILQAVRQAVHAGLWTVVVHPVSAAQQLAAERVLRATGAPFARTWGAR